VFIEGSTPIVFEGSQWKGREAKGGRGSFTGNGSRDGRAVFEFDRD